jgi:hypothetical protein
MMKPLPIIIAVAVAALVFIARPPTTLRTTPKPAVTQAPTALPIRDAVFLDLTGSRNEARIEASLDDFAPLFNRLRISGGEVGFGLIREDSNHPLIRCYVPPPPAAPPAPQPGNAGNIFVNANARKREEIERKKDEANHHAWEADANIRINNFIAAITPLLENPSNARRSDITAAIERGDLMLAEPSTFANADMAIILITDGIHNATAETTPTLHSNARVVVVNGIGSLGELAKLTPAPLQFESTAAAIRYITTEGGAHVH